MASLERPRTRMLAVASAALFLSVLVWFNYSAVLPLIVADWGLSGTHAGVVFAAFQAGYLVAIVPMGMLADRRSPRLSIAAGATLTDGASLAFALFAEGFLGGSLLWFVAGIGMAGVYVPGMRFVADWYPEADRGTAMGGLRQHLLREQRALLLAGGRGRRRTRLADGDRRDQRRRALRRAARARSGPRRARGRTRRRQTRPERAANRPYLAAVGIYSWHNWELFGMRNWISAFLLAAPAVAATGLPTLIAGTLVGVAVALGGAGNLLGGALSDRVGRLRAIAVALAASGLVSASLDFGTALSIQSLVGFSTTVVSPVVFGWALDVGGYALAFPTLALGALRYAAAGRPPHLSRSSFLPANAVSPPITTVYATMRDAFLAIDPDERPKTPISDRRVE